MEAKRACATIYLYMERVSGGRTQGQVGQCDRVGKSGAQVQLYTKGGRRSLGGRLGGARGAGESVGQG